MFMVQTALMSCKVVVGVILGACAWQGMQVLSRCLTWQSIPGHHTLVLSSCFVFMMPWYPTCEILRVLSWRNCRITIHTPWRTTPLAMESSVQILESRTVGCCCLWTTSCVLQQWEHLEELYLFWILTGFLLMTLLSGLNGGKFHWCLLWQY